MKTKTEVKKVENVQKASNSKNVKSSPTLKKIANFEPTEKVVKEELKTQTKNLIESFKPTAEERIKNAEKFQILTTKYDHLKAKKEELEKFKISSDGTKETIYFENSEGYKLEVSNSNIVNDMLKLAENTLNSILKNTQNEVQEFVI